MDKLPLELIDAILKECLYSGDKNDALQLRLVCKTFNRTLRPTTLQTLALDFSSLSKRDVTRRSDVEVLQTIGYTCKNLYIDLMVLRDEMEVEFLQFIFKKVQRMQNFCKQLYKKYTMNDDTFTESDYHRKVEDILFNCRGVEQLRLSLPFQLVGKHCSAGTRILANTLKAFASRPEEDSAPLKTLVLENVSDVAVCHLWMNPLDVMNIMKITAALEHLIIVLRRHESAPQRVALFGSCLWNLIENGENLTSLCLVGGDHDEKPPRGLKQTKFWQMSEDSWAVRTIPPPRISLPNLKCLELKKLDILPEVMYAFAEAFGPTIEELYLNEIYLKTSSGHDVNQNLDTHLWIGLPNQRPSLEKFWVAMILRSQMPRLRICRAAFLGYDQYLHSDVPGHPVFDFMDPSGLGRSMAHRFVEIVMGIQQPNTSTGEAVEYIPHCRRLDHLLHETKPRSESSNRDLTSYDTNAYQMAVENTTSSWADSLDGIFSNGNSNTLDQLRFMAETACEGMRGLNNPNQGSEDAMDSDLDSDLPDDSDLLLRLVQQEQPNDEQEVRLHIYLDRQERERQRLEDQLENEYPGNDGP